MANISVASTKRCFCAFVQKVAKWVKKSKNGISPGSEGGPAYNAR